MPGSMVMKKKIQSPTRSATEKTEQRLPVGELARDPEIVMFEKDKCAQIACPLFLGSSVWSTHTLNRPRPSDEE